MIPNLDAMEALCEAAPEGPWLFEPDGQVSAVVQEDWGESTGWIADTHREGASGAGEFIAACREGVPRLIARVRKLQEVLGKISPHTLAMGMLYEGGHERYIEVLHPRHWYGDDGQVQCCGRDFLAEASALLGEP